MQTSRFSAEQLSELETLIHRYARYSRSAGGIASVLGGVCSPLDFIVGVFLFCQAALLCAGRAYPVIGSAQAHDALPMALMALIFPLPRCA